MADVQQWREICRVVWLCIIWYTISSSNNVIGKTLLTNFPYPMTVTMVQLCTNAVLSGPVFSAWGVRPMAELSWKYYAKIIIPLAFGKFVSSLLAHVSLWKVSVSYAHTGKFVSFYFNRVLTCYVAFLPYRPDVGVGIQDAPRGFDKKG